MAEQPSAARQNLIRAYFKLHSAEAARLLNAFTARETLYYLQQKMIDNPVEIYSLLNPEIAAGLIGEMEDPLFIRLFTELNPSLAARLLSRLDKKERENRLSLLPDNVAKEISELLEYLPDTAGYLMDTRVNAFGAEDTVEEVLKRIRGIRERRIVNIHIIDKQGKLTGVIPLQEIAVSQPEERVGDLIEGPPVSIPAMSHREDVVQLLEEQKLINLPVVDIEGKLLGTIRYDALVKAAKQDASENIQAMFGAGRDEQALSKATFAIRKRLPWLEINLATAFLASAVVGMFEETIARITVLAVFLPVVAGQSGNTGSQALAVTMRGLALREIRTRHWFRVARKEITVGFVNGCAVALTTSLVVYFWTSSLGLAAVIAAAMVFSMVIAGLSGAVIPIILKAFGQDPAQSSSIILTTVTDVVGFMSFLGLATLFSAMLHIS